MSYRQCTATSKRTGERCKARAVNGRDVCYHHGGKSKNGTEVNTYRDGRYSRYLTESSLRGTRRRRTRVSS